MGCCSELLSVGWAFGMAGAQFLSWNKHAEERDASGPPAGAVLCWRSSAWPGGVCLGWGGAELSGTPHGAPRPRQRARLAEALPPLPLRLALP